MVHPIGDMGRYTNEVADLSKYGQFDMSSIVQCGFVLDFRCLKSLLGRQFSFFKERVNELENKDRDVELLRQIAAGDRAAFAEFYDRHSTLMFSIAAKILNGTSEAEDVLQEVFVQIWEKAGSFDPNTGRASSWAAIMVRNKATTVGESYVHSANGNQRSIHSQPNPPTENAQLFA